MTEPVFFKTDRGLTLSELAELTGATLRESGRHDGRIFNVAAVDRAGPRDLVFLDNVRYADSLAHTRAGACLTSERFAKNAPAHLAVLVTREPFPAFVKVARTLFPDAMRPSSMFGGTGVAPGAFVHPQARIEAGAVIDPGAVVGPGAEVGTNTVISAGAVIGPSVRVGRDCSIGPHASIIHALLGDRVIVHGGCRIGQDGFGYIMGARHRKVPQIGRVIIQDDVEIGAGTTIDRGANRDTVIGEGTKIDNLVQIGHNVTIGRHCILVGQTGISGSATIEDYVVLGARAGVNNHVTIGEGAQLAAMSIVHGDVPPGARWGGFPAKPAKLWFREIALIDRMARREAKSKDGQKDD